MPIRHLVLAAMLAIAPAWPVLAEELGSLEEVLAKMASTPESHLALAHHYRAKAEASRKDARIHRSMASTYGGKIQTRKRMRDHCDKIASRHEELTKAYAALAAEHEQAAGAGHAD